MSYTAIADYGVGNLKSLTNAMNYLGLPSRITSDRAELERADAILLPGVGAFPDAAERLRETGLAGLLAEQAARKPMLGICLGMQLLFERGTEVRPCRGLGLIGGTVERIPTELKLPHIGWNSLTFQNDAPIFRGLEDGAWVYFVHSYCGVAASEEDVIAHLPEIRKAAGDRSVLRALHFFEENKRVEAEVQALKDGRFQDFLANITASGNSSWKWLQNCFTNSNYQEQGITVALALTELFIAEKQKGACRVHGGGFAGVIMAMPPNEIVDEYIAYIEKAMGEGSAYRMSIRPYGAICMNDFA